MIVVEALMLGVIGILQGYMLKRIDNFESRLDLLKADIISIRYQLDWIGSKVDRKRHDDIQAE